MLKGKFHLIKRVKNELLSNNKITALKPMFQNKPLSKKADCWNGDGFYPDYNSNCVRYYRCSNTFTSYKRIEFFTCPESTLYDERLKTCTFKNLVLCKK